MPSDPWTLPENVFENGVGSFWKISDTRGYMRARMEQVEAYGAIHTGHSVGAALEHTKDMLRLCRTDNLGVRDLVPAFMLRLGQDQEAYDFIKWWNTEGTREDYDWGDMSLGFINLKNENLLEPLDSMDESGLGSLSMGLPLTLIKLRALLDLKWLEQLDRVLLGRWNPLPTEINMLIRREVTSSSLRRSVDNTEFLHNPAPLIAEMETQVMHCFDRVWQLNPYVWDAILEPGSHLTAQVEFIMEGTVEEMQSCLQANYYAFRETPGAIDYIRILAEDLPLPPPPRHTPMS